MTCRHAHEFMRLYGETYGGYQPAACVAMLRLEEAEAALFPDKTLVLDLRRSVYRLLMQCGSDRPTPRQTWKN